MKADQIILHFGLAKTGTTFLQEFLFKYRKDLFRDHDILYPSLGANHYDIQTILSKKPESLIQVRRRQLCDSQKIADFRSKIRQDFDDEVKKLRPPKILISSEYFTSMDDDELGYLRDFCFQYGKSVQAIIYIRDPCSFSVSITQQNIRDGIHQAPVKMGYQRVQAYMLRRLTQFFGDDLIVRPFLRGVSGEQTDILADFFETTKISRNPQASTYTIPGNPSMGRVITTVMAEINRMWPPYDQKGFIKWSKYRSTLLGLIQNARFKDMPLRISRQRSREIMSMAREDLEYIHSHFFGGQPIFIDHYRTQHFDEFNCDISIDNIDRVKLVRLMVGIFTGMNQRKFSKLKRNFMGKRL